ncbi:MAG: hypothetical protein BWY36_00037 [Candidatus Diapherotrites archaeon ADurb.Bin253]|jgi:hypothetical protein|nr:MAG: hypothetical protein BWY36_00037 [Candidatus Diapherotrites archaeon ADurb.Bin253]HNZ52111.1 hypothetical protein [Candidatus Pacearchaeota archaeon]HOC97064.1 hypothetical protein [Candidatus Pacearchaeota archaeon]HOH03965.1 hypothetical protein [Candidatus Pacearchaeota archaeon]HPX74374.1 hypothetical protein [Candidatus Pacearchaeota archaeon]
MNNKIRIGIKTGIITLIIIVNLLYVSSANIGVSPANVYFKDVLRGGYAERIVTITVDSEEPTKISLEPRGEIVDWVSFEEKEFEVSRNKPYYLKIILQPPVDIPNGNYTGFLRVTTSSKNKGVEGQATGVINAALDLYLEVKITDVEFSSCRAWDFQVESVEKGDDILFKVKVLNEGNVRLYPTIKIDMWDQERTELVKQVEFSEDMIIPTTEKELNIKVESSDMNLGQYWAEITSIECYAAQTLTFDILEEGALKAQGNLLRISSPTWIKVDDTTIIEALFENTGEKNVNARFKGEITLGSRVIQILESELSSVSIGEIETFKFYFTPRKEGKYIVTGMVFYDGKRTFEKSTVINVEKKGFDIGVIRTILIYLILLIVIAYLAYKIKKEKRRNNLRWKR